MKVKAFILLVCILTYVGEWLAMPEKMGMAIAFENNSILVTHSLLPPGSTNPASPFTAIALPRTAHTSPRTAPAAHACCPETKGGPSRPNASKAGKEGNGATNCCLSCPMCYTTVLPDLIGLTAPLATNRRTYPFYRSACLFGYYASAWKPPNQA